MSVRLPVCERCFANAALQAAVRERRLGQLQEATGQLPFGRRPLRVSSDLARHLHAPGMRARTNIAAQFGRPHRRAYTGARRIGCFFMFYRYASVVLVLPLSARQPLDTHLRVLHLQGCLGTRKFTDLLARG